MVWRPGGKEGRPSGGADSFADISASLGVAELAQTSEEEQAFEVVVVAMEERGEEGMSPYAAGAAAAAFPAVVVATDARRRRLEVSLTESHQRVSMAVERGRRGGRARKKVR
jgi:hypothetical protein